MSNQEFFRKIYCSPQNNGPMQGNNRMRQFISLNQSTAMNSTLIQAETTEKSPQAQASRHTDPHHLTIETSQKFFISRTEQLPPQIRTLACSELNSFLHKCFLSAASFTEKEVI
ncbi:hypothetical protein LguiA_026253 [Lonicera macranthoides]